ncbi:hypothetical protein ASG89_20320 [Paenibacillus sp. Soil766]|uniref:DUF421 domain-containing protein n=1 Tax=Paenibacillus sp. Soil766 TaxID=1736404 RepID=UPI0007097829|nr:YetF domain-containing protein [Paenibacillus sp. Soil766]KRF05478.1 hypothetical protein ASG89_20320 [Paenibacillus sp. Soil766]
MTELLFGGSNLPIWMFAIRAFVLYIALIIVTRWTGHRQVGILSGHNYLIAAGIVGLAGIRMVNPKSSLVSGLVIVVIYGGISVLLSKLDLRRPFLVDREPIALIEQGKLVPRNLVRARVTLDELLALLRGNGCPRISDAWAAVLEPTGKLGVILRESAGPVTRKIYGLPSIPVGSTVPLIQDGRVHNEGLKQIKKDKTWLKRTLDQQFGILDWSQLWAVLAEPNGTLVVLQQKEHKL